MCLFCYLPQSNFNELCGILTGSSAAMSLSACLAFFEKCWRRRPASWFLRWVGCCSSPQFFTLAKVQTYNKAPAPLFCFANERVTWSVQHSMSLLPELPLLGLVTFVPAVFVWFEIFHRCCPVVPFVTAAVPLTTFRITAT